MSKLECMFDDDDDDDDDKENNINNHICASIPVFFTPHITAMDTYIAADGCCGLVVGAVVLAAVADLACAGLVR